MAKSDFEFHTFDFQKKLVKTVLKVFVDDFLEEFAYGFLKKPMEEFLMKLEKSPMKLLRMEFSENFLQVPQGGILRKNLENFGTLS